MKMQRGKSSAKFGWNVDERDLRWFVCKVSVVMLFALL
jgi:hypothetical protein